MRLPERPTQAVLGTGPIADDRPVAVSPHHLASQAALDVMAAGGNAVDGAVALNAVLGVVLPDTCGPGGDLFALVHEPGGDAPLTLNSSGRAGTNADAATLRDAGFTEMPALGHHTITVPGCVDGWEALLGRLGRLTMPEVLAPAIGHASNGFPASAELSSSLRRYEQRLAGQPSAVELYPSGDPPPPGGTVVRPALARTLSEIASGGRSVFYLGAPGEAIVDVTAGAITRDDLEQSQAEWVDPLAAELFGRTAWTIPPNSQGYLTLAGLWLFEQLDPPADPDDPDYHHALIEAYRAVAWERREVVADPTTAPLPPSELVSPDRLRPRLAAIDPDSVALWPAAAPAPGGTAYMCVRDAAGMAVSLIQSNYYGIGTGLSAGATGVWLHNRGGGFDLRPGHPNELKPGRRPLHTLSPTLWTRNGTLDLVLGTRGGDHQPQLLMQVAAHHYHAGVTVDDAQRVQRWTTSQLSGPTSLLEVETRLRGDVVASLRRRGHQVEEAAEWVAGWGPISMIDRSDGLRAAADPRVSTSAALAG